MTFANSKSSSSLAIAVLCGVFAFSAGFVNPSVVHAGEDGWGDIVSGGEGWGDVISGNESWGDMISGNESWGDMISGNESWGDTISGNESWGDMISGNESWGDTISGTDAWGNTISGTDAWGNTISGTDAWGNTISGTDAWGNTISGSQGSYYDSGCGCMQSSSGGYGQTYSGGSYRGYSSGGFTITPPRVTVSTPPTYYPPQYIPQPPHYTPPTYIPQPPHYTPPPTYTPPTNITNTSCTNNSCNNTSTVTNINQTPQPTYYPVVYQQPVQVPTYYPQPIPTPVPQPIPSNLYCQIYASPTAVQNGQAAYLSWSSTGATYATLSDGIGNVAPNGTLSVRPETSRNYILTVYGYGGSRTCSASVTVIGSTVSLTQIPYTGFDFGSTGNMIYWMSILAFAASLAYLALYFQGGALAIAGNAFGGQKKAYTMTPAQTIKVPAPAPTVIQMPAAQAPVIAKKEVVVPVTAAEFKTTDKMNMVFTTGEAPRLVINRV